MPNYLNFSNTERQLWTRLWEFDLAPISGSLRRDFAWSEEFTDRVIFEFKRYVFLSVTSSARLSPSATVDLVWHKFLLYTKLYWEDFCPNVLKRPFHHNPSQGTPAEAAKYQQMYQDTLMYYQQILGEQPPPDIWDTTDE